MKKTNNNVRKLFIKKGDMVKVLSGDDKNKQGKVLTVSPKAYRAIIEGVNYIFKHRKPSVNKAQGSIEKKEAPIHISNLMLVDPATGQATKVGRRRDEQGKLQRYSKKTGKIIK